MHQSTQWLAVAAVVLACMCARGHSEEVMLAQRGHPLHAVVVGESAAAAVRETAADLAQYLGRISGATFEVQTGDGATGIAVGLASDFPALGYADRFDPSDPMRQEEYILRSHAGGMHLVGASALAVSHAVWDLLHRLGHRQYQPNAHWEVVPQLPPGALLRVDVDEFQKPDFINRWLWNGGGYFDYDKVQHERWYARNRSSGRGFRLSSSHVYDMIVTANRQAFKEHPEYLALRKGERQAIRGEGNKFCLSNPEVRKLAVEWALGLALSRPDIAGVSMEPSDGTNWCDDSCQPCTQMGSVTDRAITLANETAVALGQAFDVPKYVGILAYGEHSPPPTIAVHPRVVVNVAKGFIRGGYRFEELIRLWGDTGVMLGVYDYLGVSQWSWCLPGRGRSTRSDYAARELPWMHEHNVRLYTGESEANWGAAGPNYYFVARVLWDVSEAQRLDEMRSEFFELCFGSARQAMRQFYDLIDGSKRPLMSRDLIGRMYRLIDQAMRESSDPAVIARLRDLAVYTRYVEFYLEYNTADGEARQAGFERLIRFAWQTRDTLVVHTREVHRNLGYSDKRVTMEEHQRYKYPDDQNPWKQNPTLTTGDIDGFARDGIEHNPLFDFEPRAFGTALVPAAPLKLTSAEPGAFPGTQNLQVFYTWVDQAPATIKLTCTGGLIRHYRDRGDARVELFRASDADDIPLDEARVPPDGEPYPIELRTSNPGLHRIELTDGGDRSRLEWPAGTPMTFWSDTSATISYADPWTLYFYVPRGTQRVAGYSSSPTGTMLAPDGRTAFDFATLGGPGFFDVPVPAGQDGKLWRLARCNGQRLLMTVPPALARSADELLLPAEVVEADR